MENWTPDTTVKREGYKTFLGLVWFLIKVNRRCRATGAKSRFELTVPVRWI